MRILKKNNNNKKNLYLNLKEGKALTLTIHDLRFHEDFEGAGPGKIQLLFEV